MVDDWAAQLAAWPELSMAAGRGTTADGTNYRVDGRGPAVVLLHGIGLDHSIWREYVAKLRAQFTVISYDLLGHGESATPPARGTLSDFSKQLRNLLDTLGVERAALVGHSLGALVVQDFTLKNPGRVARIVLLNSVSERSDEARSAVLARVYEVERRGADALLEHVLTRWISAEYRAANPGLIARLKLQLTNNGSEGFVEAYRIFADADLGLSGRLGAIRVPALVMTGELDAGSTPAMSRVVASAIPGAQLGVAPGMRHLMLLEASGPVSQTLQRFLAK